MMLYVHDEETKFFNTMRGVSVKQYKHISHMPGLFFWMKDDVEAVFLLSHTGAGAQGMAFFTRDSKIIDILAKTWKNVKKEGKEGQDLVDTFNDDKNMTNFLKLFPEEKHEIIKAYLKTLGIV